MCQIRVSCYTDYDFNYDYDCNTDIDHGFDNGSGLESFRYTCVLTQIKLYLDEKEYKNLFCLKIK